MPASGLDRMRRSAVYDGRTRLTRCGRWVGRLLVLLGLLAGLVAMHGMASGHDMSMPAGHLQAQVAASSEAAVHVVTAEPAVSASQLRSEILGGGQSGRGGMGQCCLAVLTGAGLALLVLMRARSARRTLVEPVNTVPPAWSTYRVLAPPRPPNIYALCVLRT
jgi:hypothetical protein